MVSEIRKSLYVDELICEGPTEERAKRLKSEATEMLTFAKFDLHKWHSNRRKEARNLL